MSEPWMKFYPRDWRGDQALRAVSLAARGLWIECLCIMHEAKPYGHLVLNGAPVGGDTLARMTGVPVDEVSDLMAELRQAGVLSVTGKGVVFSRRMTKDHARAQKGRKAASKRWSQASDGVEQSEAPTGLPSSLPITQKPDTRNQKEIEPIAQRPIAAAPREKIPNLVDRLAEAAGIRGNLGTGLAFPGEIIALLDSYDLEREVLPAIRAKPNPEARKWSYFVPQIHEYVRKIRGIAADAKATPAPRDFDWRKALEVFREGTWADGWGPKPGERGCRVPTGLLAEFGYERAA